MGWALKVNILGTEYTVIENGDNKKLDLSDADGLAGLYAKELVIRKGIDHDDSGKCFDNLPEYRKKVIRHEIIHAFFHESGATEWCKNEDLIEWIALMLPRLAKACEIAECL